MTDLFPLVWYITGFITKVSADITTNRDSYLFPGWQTGAGLQSLSGGYGSLTGSRDDCEFVPYAVTVSLTKSSKSSRLSLPNKATFTRVGSHNGLAVLMACITRCLDYVIGTSHTGVLYKMRDQQSGL